MAKGAKNEVPGPSSAANRDIIQRLNFLYQASVYLNSADTSSDVPQTHNETDTRPKNKKARLNDISRSYIDTMKVVGTRTTVKMDPSVKRTLCKGCNTVLVPGSTASVRTKKSLSHRHAVTYTCLTCKHSRRIPAPSYSKPEQTTPSPPSTSVTETDSQKTKRHKKRVSRPPPLFARTGHVVYRGNERINEEPSQGNGIYIA
ncbi:hypothetical protein VKT23_001204 [Stygiomarasmius scandens]|uniref:Rpr2-domain-containing protein n=1 Tax=Marasmiellus scandens TaxID=2682957 RepID=A0ABR1KBT7_9AGAR